MRCWHLPHRTARSLLACFGLTCASAQERHVQSAVSNPNWAGDGTSGAPFQNVIEGVLDVPSGGSVIIRPGTYAEKMFITKPMQLRATGGPAAIGAGVSPGFITCGGPMRSDEDGDWIDDACEEFLAQKYAPIVYHSSDESNFPTSVDWFLRRSSLWFYDDKCDPSIFDPLSGDLHVRIADTPSQRDLLSGVMSNQCDDQYMVYSNGTRSSRKHRTFYLADVPGEARVGSLNSSDWLTYYHAYPNDSGGVTIQYWRFYAYNDAANDHGGDWEGIHVVLDAALNPAGVAFLGHTDFASTPVSQVQWEGTHPVVFSEGGGHASSATSQGHFGSPILAKDCFGGPAILRLSDPCTFVRQETWKDGQVTCANPLIAQLIGQRSPGGGLLNLGSRIAPLNGQVFVQYSGIWGSPGTFYEFSGYWGPAYNETGAGSPPRFLPAWGFGRTQTHLTREWQATSTSP